MMVNFATDKYLALFNNMEQGFCIIETLFNETGEPNDYCFLDVNPIFEKQTGLHQAAGKTMRQLQTATEGYWLGIFGKVVSTGQPAHHEMEAAHLTGGTWYEVFVCPFGSPGARQLAVIINDITLRKQEEDRQAVLLKLNDALRPLADPSAIQTVSADLLGKHLKVNQCHYSEVVGEYVFISHSYSDGLPPMEGWFFYHEYGQRLVKEYREGHVQVCNDTITDLAIPEVERAGMAGARIGAYIAAPLVKNGAWVATLAVHNIKPRQWKQSEIDLLAEFAERTWAAVERAKAEEQLAKELEDTRKLQQISNRMIEENNIDTLYEAILGSAIDIMHSDMASIQILASEKNELLLLASKGFHPDSVKMWERICANATTSCRQALEKGERVVFADVDDPACHFSKEDSDGYHNVGIAAVQSTPLISRSGKSLGMISTHWKKKHHPSNRELHLLDVLARQAADLIEQRQVEEAQRKSEALLTSVFRVLPVGLGFTDVKGNFLLLNDEMRRFLSAGQLLSLDNESRNRWIGWNPDGTPLERKNYPGIRALRGEPILPFIEMIYIDDDNREIWTRVASIPLRDGNGEIIGAVTVVTDIDELKRTAEALQESERQLKQLLKEKDEFIGIASHELKTPITSMKAYAEIVQEKLEGAGNNNDSELLSRLNAQIDRLTVLINHLLDTSRISQGQFKLAFEEIDINELLRERIEEIRKTTDHRFDLQTQHMSSVVADRERIGQVINNLLSNAIKYSPGGTTIAITSLAEQNGIKVSVRDDGYGIPEADIKRVFERFFRVTANNRDTIPGMGLGLYITAQIIQKHGGTISVQSKEGKGSVFSFILPYKYNESL